MPYSLINTAILFPPNPILYLTAWDLSGYPGKGGFYVIWHLFSYAAFGAISDDLLHSTWHISVHWVIPWHLAHLTFLCLHSHFAVFKYLGHSQNSWLIDWLIEEVLLCLILQEKDLKQYMDACNGIMHMTNVMVCVFHFIKLNWPSI